MPRSIYMLAGQSNASAMRDEFADALAAQLPGSQYTDLVVSSSGAPLTWARGANNNNPLDWATNNELPDQLIAALVAALDADPTARLGAIVWVQGEADTYGSSNAEDYADDLAALYTYIRDELADRYTGRDIGLNNFELVISGLSENAPDASGRSNWETVRQAQYDLAESTPGITFVNPDAVATIHNINPSDMFADGLHYNSSFATHLASMLAEQAISEAGSLVSGMGGEDTLNGGGGDDTLVGGGDDTLNGGDGDDIYYINANGDYVVEHSGGGTDQVYALGSTSLYQHSQFIENLTLEEGGDYNAVGNAQDNVITGNSSDNVLNGARGNDTLIGGDGNDRFRDSEGDELMIGGNGNDKYWIDSAGDVIVELEDGGRDRVISSVSFSLRDHSHHIEELRLIGEGNLRGVGNAADNKLTGNPGDNDLNGGWGDDWINAGAGDDMVIGDRGDDTMVGGSGADVFRFENSDGDDVIEDFEVGTDLIWITSGANSMADLEIESQGHNTLITYSGETILLEDVNSASLNAFSFDFG